MKKLSLILVVLLAGVLLAGLDYWANFYGKQSVFHSPPATQTLQTQLPSQALQEITLPTNQQPATPPAEFSGTFPLLLAASANVFPYKIASQQRVFDLFGIFDLNSLPGLQVVRYDMVPAGSDAAVSPIQIYELQRANQSAGITFLSLKTHLSTQVDPVNELNQPQTDYALNVLFYNPSVPSESAFMLAENGLVLAFVYPKASAENFSVIQSLLKAMPENLTALSL